MTLEKIIGKKILNYMILGKLDLHYIMTWCLIFFEPHSLQITFCLQTVENQERIVSSFYFFLPATAASVNNLFSSVDAIVKSNNCLSNSSMFSLTFNVTPRIRILVINAIYQKHCKRFQTGKASHRQTRRGGRA